VGSTVITVRASDKDAAKNGELLYSIKSQSSKPDVFRIEPKTGVISTRLPLDREKEATHSLVIEATDQVHEAPVTPTQCRVFIGTRIKSFAISHCVLHSIPVVPVPVYIS
jgi:hypothetical protein